MPIKTINAGGVTLQIDTDKDIRKQVREQAPEVYRQVFLGENPDRDRAAQSAAVTGARQVAEQMNPFQAALVGAGSTASNFLSGAEMIGHRLFGNERSAEELAQQRGQDNRAMDALRREHPVSTFIGESAPYMAIPGAPMGLAAGGTRLAGGAAAREAAKRYGTEAAIGGTEALISSGGDAGAALAGAVGGAGGAAAGNALFRRGAGTPSPTAQAAADEGFILSPADRIGAEADSKMRSFQREIEQRPLVFGGAGRSARGKNQQNLNRSLRNALDLPSNAPLTRETFGKVRRDLEEAFAYPLEKSGRLADELDDLANTTTVMSARTPPQKRALDAIGNKIADRSLTPRELSMVMRELALEVADQNNSREVRAVFEAAAHAVAQEVGRQHGGMAEKAIRLAVDRRFLADAAERSLRGPKQGGHVDYARMLTRELHGRNGGTMLDTLRTAQRSGDWGLGLTDIDVQNPLTNWKSDLAGLGVGGAGAFAGGVPGVIASLAATRAGGELWNRGMIPRAVNQGLFGTLMSPENAGRFAPAAQRIGRSMGMATNDPEERRYE